MLPVDSTSTIPAMLAFMGLHELSAHPFQLVGLVAAHAQAATAVKGLKFKKFQSESSTR
jgi:hypothetical protein